MAPASHQGPIQWVPWATSPAGEANWFPKSNTNIKNEWSCDSTHISVFMVPCIMKCAQDFYFQLTGTKTNKIHALDVTIISFDNKELYTLYSSPRVIRVIKSRRQMDGACSTYRGEQKCIQGFGGDT
jgi:hypothetical protein